MTPEYRAVFDDRVSRARAGDETAIAFLRILALRFCTTAPPDALIKVVEAFNDAYVDEQIDYAMKTGDTE
jgi:hypothetical protein